DKLRTCQWLERNGLPVPGYADCADAAAVAALVQRCGFPLIAKPRFGKGSDTVLTIRDEDELRRVAVSDEGSGEDPGRWGYRPSEMVLQELLGDARQEYTAGCFSD